MLWTLYNEYSVNVVHPTWEPGLQELSSPVRQYKMLSLKQMFRSRGSTPGNLQKAFFRASDADVDLA